MYVYFSNASSLLSFPLSSSTLCIDVISSFNSEKSNSFSLELISLPHFVLMRLL